MEKIFIAFVLAFYSTVCFAQQKIQGSYDPSSKLFSTRDTTYHIDFFQNGVARIYQAGYIGLMDSTGKILIRPSYDQIFDFDGDVAEVNIRKKNGLIHKSGKVLVEPFDGDIEPFVDGFAKCKEHFFDSRIINRKGEYINEFSYDVLGDLNNGRFPFIRGTNFGLLTTEGEEIIVIEDYNEQEFDGLVHYAHYGAFLMRERKEICNLFEFSSGRALTFAKINDSIKFGCIDINGNLVIPTKYDRIEPFENGLAVAQSNNLWGVIDSAGNTVLTFVHESVRIVDENHFIISEDSLFGVVDRSGKVIIPIKYQSIKAGSKNTFIVSKNGKYGLVNDMSKKSLSIKHPALIHLCNDLYITHNDKNWGVIKASGRIVLPFRYDGVALMNDSTLIASKYQSDRSLNTGVPRYVYNGLFFQFDLNGKQRENAESFSLTIVGYNDNHRKENVVKMGPSRFVPIHQFSISGLNYTKTYKTYPYVQSLKGGFKIVGIVDTAQYSTTVISLSGMYDQPTKYKKGIINSKGAFVVPMIYDELQVDQSRGYAEYFGITQSAPTNLFVAKLGEFKGVVNIDNRIIIPFKYNDIRLYPGIVFLAKRTEYLDAFDEIEEFYDTGISDMNGNVLTQISSNHYPAEILENWFDDDSRVPKE